MKIAKHHFITKKYKCEPPHIMFFLNLSILIQASNQNSEEDIDDGNDFKSRKHGIPFTAPSMEGHIVTHIQSTNAICLP